MTVTLLSRAVDTAKDAHGNDTYTDSVLTVPGCIVWPGDSSEAHAANDLVDTRITVVFPAGTVILPTDAIRYGGHDYEVHGEPKTWVSPWSGYAPGVVVIADRVTG